VTVKGRERKFIIQHRYTAERGKKAFQSIFPMQRVALSLNRRKT
jgi:hypothetical protein